MRHLRLIATASLAASALFAGSANAGTVPAPHADCSYVRGVSADDGHTNQTGQGHSVHGNGWGYGHGCGDTDGGGDTGGGTTNTF